MKKVLFGLFGFLVLFISAPLIYPKPLFPYAVSSEGLSVHSDMQLSQVQTEKFLKEVKAKLKDAPIHYKENPMQIYVANVSWHRTWLWLIHRGAQVGGFVVAPLTREHAFFSGADFESNELISPSGYRPHPPRTLVYYGVHELMHVVTIKNVGWYRFATMPVWVREGLADYVAMPTERADKLYAKIGQKKLDLSMMKAHGVYAPYRLLVIYFLEEEGWSIERLLESDLTLEEAQAIVFGDLEKSLVSQEL